MRFKFDDQRTIDSLLPRDQIEFTYTRATRSGRNVRRGRVEGFNAKGQTVVIQEPNGNYRQFDRKYMQDVYIV